MRFLANISPTLKLTRRLSCNSNVRRYTSLVKVLPCHHRYSNNLMLPNIALRRFYCVDKTDKNAKVLNKTIDSVALKDKVIQEHAESSNLIMPMAVLNLNLPSAKSTQVLLIPLNWPNTDIKTMGNIISSIFAQRTHLQQIEAFSEALRGVPNLQQLAEKEAKKNEEISQEISELEHSNEAKADNASTESSLMNITGDNMAHLDRLAAAVEKALQQCCLQSMQMCVDANIFEGTIKGLKFRPLPNATDSNKANDPTDFAMSTSQIKGKPLSLSSIMQIDASKLNLEEISWNKTNPFPEMHTSSLTNITFPINMIRKSYSTRSSMSSQSNAKSPAINRMRYGEEEASSSDQSILMDMTPKRKASNVSTSKCNANYDFPFLSNLFGAKELLLSCDAYNKALIEASKRRAALTNCTAELKSVKDVATSRPQVTSIKGCTAPSMAGVHQSEPCPPPPPPATQASQGDCKYDDPCKPPECPNPCKDEMEKLKRKEKEDAKAKRNKMPIGCVSPKCKKDDGCSKLKKSPCKKASSEQTAVKKADGDCKYPDPCKPPECPNPCKDEMDKLKRQKEQESKRNKNKMPTGCISPKCKKDDGCSKLKKSPCKKASGTNLSSATVLQCSKSGGGKGKSDSCSKGKKDKKNPCADDHKEYKPKCNTDPCKKESDSCGGGEKKKKKPEHCNKNKKKPVDKCKTKKADSCGGDKKKKEDPCKKKKDDPCKKKKDDPCGKKKEDPCKKKKEDPCKKKKEDPCGKKKEDPCKKKKEDPCKKKKDDPCKKKKSEKSSPCGSKKKDPCAKKEKSPCSDQKKKDDPCKKKSKSNDKSGSKGKKAKASCGTIKRDTKPNCKKNDKCFSTLAINTVSNSAATTSKRTFTNLAFMPTLRNKNMYSFGFMRHYSSKGGKGGKKDKKDIDFGRISQCKSLAAVVPPKRTPAYNPHPKEGLRKCYATYDMDCKKLCKDARKTACKKYAFLKSTDNDTRKGKK